MGSIQAEQQKKKKTKKPIKQFFINEDYLNDPLDNIKQTFAL